MTSSDHTFIDTDLHLHRLSIDPKIREAAQLEFDTNEPTAISAFTLVELKGSYIQRLKLLSEKVSRSDSLGEAIARIENTGGRASKMMIAQIVTFLGGMNWSVTPWEEAQRELLVRVDTQIGVSWEEFKAYVDDIFDDFNCNRASEEPFSEGRRWNVTIPICRDGNGNCKILEFMDKFKEDLQRLVKALEALESEKLTDELYKIRDAAKRTIASEFPKYKIKCRSIGDLLIALQSKAGRRLVSSNHREHSHMHEPLGYTLKLFPVAELRSK